MYHAMVVHLELLDQIKTKESKRFIAIDVLQGQSGMRRKFRASFHVKNKNKSPWRSCSSAWQVQLKQFPIRRTAGAAAQHLHQRTFQFNRFERRGLVSVMCRRWLTGQSDVAYVMFTLKIGLCQTEKVSHTPSLILPFYVTG